MIIKEIRVKTNLSQIAFAKLTGIPLRTIQAWEQGTREPPEYVPRLIYKALKYENKKRKEGKIMIDFGTLKFLDVLNKLAEKSKTGIIPFSKIDGRSYDMDSDTTKLNVKDDNGNIVEYNECIVYDDEHETTDSIFGETGSRAYPVIQDMSVTLNHHDVAGLYSDTYDCDIEVIISKTEKPYVRVQGEGLDDCIIIEDGKWYFA